MTVSEKNKSFGNYSGIVCFSFSKGILCFQVLDEKQQKGLAGALFHQYDGPGHPGDLGHCDAGPGLQGDSHQERMEAEPCRISQYLGPQLPLRDNLGSHLPGLHTSL